MKNTPLIAIVGRPNVGKSTLFNRIVGARRSIVTDEPGITRDRIYANAKWSGRTFEIVDTGGMDPTDDTEIPLKIIEQAEVAIEAAAILIFVVDGRTSITSADQELARLLRRKNKTVFLAINKVDSDNLGGEIAEFYRLGFDRTFPISAEHVKGITDLLDEVVRTL